MEKKIATLRREQLATRSGMDFDMESMLLADQEGALSNRHGKKVEPPIPAFQMHVSDLLSRKEAKLYLIIHRRLAPARGFLPAEDAGERHSILQQGWRPSPGGRLQDEAARTTLGVDLGPA